MVTGRERTRRPPSLAVGQFRGTPSIRRSWYSDSHQMPNTR